LPVTAWLLLCATLAVLLVVDLAIVRGRGGMSLRLAAVASAAWVAVALAFFAVLLLAGEDGRAGAFMAGYLVERSLSLDNVFVFLLLFSALGVPAAQRGRLLTYGIVGALVLRAALIVGGAALLSAASWVGLALGALLVWTGWRMFRHRHDRDAEARLVERVRRRLPSTAAGALIALVVVDLVFALDSVAAILAITGDTFVVFAANAFALLGLRPLFFLLEGLVERLHHLKTALAAVLVFVGLKMAAGELVGHIGPEISLPVIAAILAAGVVASLVQPQRRPSEA
jgi:tellurite resistance protein TerC